MNIKDFQDSLDYLFKAQLTAFVWGHAGIGKTSVIREYAKNKGYHFFPLYLGTQGDVGDILGLASFLKDDNGSEVATQFAMPVWLKNAVDYCNDNPDSAAVIFLDEFNRGRRDVLNGMFSLALDKTFHTIKLPENCYIIAAGNPPTDEYYTTDVDETALMARFVHIKLEPKVQEWIDYAKSIELEPTLISFIREQPDLLSDAREDFKLPVKVDRRAYERLGRLFKLNTPTNLISQLMVGILGIERTVAYEQHLKTAAKPLTGAEVMTGEYLDKVKMWSKEGDIQSSMISSTMDNLRDYLLELNDVRNDLSKDEQKSLVEFIEAVPKDMAYVFMNNMISGKAGRSSLWDKFTRVTKPLDIEKRLVDIARKAKGEPPLNKE